MFQTQPAYGVGAVVKNGKRCILAAVLSILGTFSALHAATSEDTISTIRKDSYHALSSIATEACTVQVVSSNGGVWEEKHFHDGPRYRVEREHSKSAIINGKPLDQEAHIWAFNGKRHQTYNNDSRILTVSDKLGPIGGRDPVLVPYAWLSAVECNSSYREILLSAKRWEEVFSKATLVGDGECQGKKCFIVEFPQACTSPAAVFRVFFLKEESCFPIKYERRLADTGASCSIFEVESYMTPVINGQRLIMPLVMTFKQNNADGMSWKGTTKTVVDPKNVVLNSPIDDSLFTLDADLASLVYDVQGEVERARKAEEAYKDVLGSPASDESTLSRTALVLLNAIVIGVLIFTIWKKSGTK